MEDLLNWKAKQPCLFFFSGEHKCHVDDTIPIFQYKISFCIQGFVCSFWGWGSVADDWGQLLPYQSNIRVRSLYQIFDPLNIPTCSLQYKRAPPELGGPELTPLIPSMTVNINPQPDTLHVLFCHLLSKALLHSFTIPFPFGHSGCHFVDFKDP